jgi:hypothetical protein
MQTYNPGHVELRQLVCVVSGLHWYEMCHFCEGVYNDSDGIIAPRGLGQSNDKIHTYVVPFPLGNWQRLQQPSWFLVLCLDLVANITTGDIVCDIILHSWPPKCLSQVLVHLGTSRMNRVCGFVCLLEYLLPQVVLVGHTYPLLEPHGSLLILMEGPILPLLNQILDFPYFFVLLLCFLNFLHQCWHNFQCARGNWSAQHQVELNKFLRGSDLVVTAVFEGREAANGILRQLGNYQR